MHATASDMPQQSPPRMSDNMPWRWYLYDPSW